jgi:hypothetical protein
MHAVRRRATGLLTVFGLLASALVVVVAAAPAQRAQAAPSPAGGRYVPLVPARILTKSVGGAGVTLLSPLGFGGVPGSGVSAVALQISAKGNGTGAVAVAPAGATTNTTSTINYTPNVESTDGVVVKLGTGNQVAIDNRAAVAIALKVDVVGYYLAPPSATGSTYVPLPPARIVPGAAITTAGGSVLVSPLGTGGIPAGNVTAVVGHLIVKAAAAGTVGTAAVHPDGIPRPGTADVSYGADSWYSTNLVAAMLSPNGTFRITTSTPSTVYFDLEGYYQNGNGTGDGATFIGLAQPARVQNGDAIGANSTATFTLLGRGGIPASGVGAVAYTLTAKSTAQGDLTPYPTGTAAPPTRSLHYHSNGYYPALQITRTGTGGQITIRNTGPAINAYIDVLGYFATAAATRPGPPTAVQASASDGVASLTWTPPAGNGGSPVLDYTVTSSPGNLHLTTSAPGGTITGLRNGTDYTFTVVARNAVGSSPESAASNQVTPAPPSPPARPLITDTYPRDSAVRVSWSPPLGGTAGVSDYLVTATLNGAAAGSVTAPAGATEAIVTGLLNGTGYRFTVTARNGAGGTASPASPPVAPVPADVPVKPSMTGVIALNGRIDVQWVPAADGGAPVTGYTVVAGPRTLAIPADTTVASITGLANNTEYTVSVIATNKAGDSAAATAKATPLANRPPAAPRDLTATVPAAGSLTAVWSAPIDTGTSAVLDYTVTAIAATGASRSVTATGTTGTVTGLSSTQPYRVEVTARNASGAGPASVLTDGVTPDLAVKAAPVVLTAAAAATLRQAHPDGTLDFEQPPAQVTALLPGALLVVPPSAQAPTGLLRKVTATSSASGLFVVSTVDAALADALSVGELAGGTSLERSDVAGLTALIPGVRLREPTVRGRTAAQGAPRGGATTADGPSAGIRDGSIVLELSMDVGESHHIAGKIEGQAVFTPNEHHDIDIGLTHIDTDFELSLTYQVEARIKVGVSAGWKRDFKLATLHGRPIVVQLGPVPVVFTPEVQFHVEPRLDGSVGITAAVTYGHKLGFHAHTHNVGQPVVQNIDEDTPGNGASAGPYGDGAIRLGMPIDFMMFVYGVAGAGLGLVPYLELRADTTQNPWWEFRVGRALRASLELKILGKDLVSWHSGDLVSEFITLAHADGGFQGVAVDPAQATAVVGQAVPHTLRVINVPTGLVHWSVVGGPGSIDATGTYRSDVVGTATVRGELPPNPALPRLSAEAVVTVGPRSPDAPRDATAQAGPLSSVVRWSPPANDGGAPVTEYAVTTVPPTSTTFVPANITSVRIRGLASGAEYAIQVWALNSAGRSAPATAGGAVRPYDAFIRIGSAQQVAVDELGRPDDTGHAGVLGAVLSGNGRYAFFLTWNSSNLAPPEIFEPGRNRRSLLRKDLVTGEITVASRGLDAEALDAGFALYAERGWASSYDGNTFEFLAPTNTGPRLYVHTFSTGVTWDATAGMSFYDIGGVALSSDGNTVAFLLRDGSPTVQSIWRAVRGAGPAQRIDVCHYDPCSGSSPSAPDMSGDGKRIVYKSYAAYGDERAYLYDVATGATTQLSDGPPEVSYKHALAPHISRDGRTITYGLSVESLLGDPLVSVESLEVQTVGGAPRTLAFNHDRLPYGAFGLSGDGHLLSYRAEVPDPVDHVFDAPGHVHNALAGATLDLTGPEDRNERDIQIADDGRVLLWSASYCSGSPCTQQGGVWSQLLG